MAMGDIPCLVWSECEIAATFGACGDGGCVIAVATVIDEGSPWIGDGIAEDVVVDIIGVFGAVREFLGGADAVLHDEEGEGETVGKGLEIFQIDDDLDGVVLLFGRKGDGDKVRLIECFVGGGDDIGDGIEEGPTRGGTVATYEGDGVLTAGGDTEIVAPLISGRSAEVGTFAYRAAEGEGGVVDGDGYESAIHGVYSIVDGDIGCWAVDATDAGEFLDEGSLGFVADAVAVFPLGFGAAVKDIVVILYFVA